VLLDITCSVLLLAGGGDEGLGSSSAVDLDDGVCCVLICVFVSWLAATWEAFSKSSGLLTVASESPSPLEMAFGSDFSNGAAGVACPSERSMGLAISSKSELSSPDSSSSLSSVNFEARSLIEAVCWFIECGAPRRADADGVASGSGSGAFLTGEGALGDGARAVGL